MLTRKGQGLPLNTIIIAIIVIIVLVVIILITTGQLANWQETLRGGGNPCTGPNLFCSALDATCGPNAQPDTEGRTCAAGATCCVRTG